MSTKSQRSKEKTKLDTFSKIVHKYAYAETLALVSLFLLIGYFVDPKDMCLLNADIPYVIIILTVIILFHGFESGVLALSIISLMMWFFYPTFHYIDFLIFLLITLLLSQFHYYWNVRLRQAEVDAEYKSQKLTELSRAFYSLKISHDQLEKNYVVKPMSIRNAIKYILNLNDQLIHDEEVLDKQKALHYNLLELLEKSFNLKVGHIIYYKEDAHNNPDHEFTQEYLAFTSIGTDEKVELESMLEDYIVDKSIARKTPAYISDEAGEPNAINKEQSKYLAAIPAIINKKIVSILVIEKMPFMFFNREYLTSATIIHEYFALETHKSMELSHFHKLELIDNKEFQFEIFRMKKLYTQYKVNSVLLVLRTMSDLRTARLMDHLERMLRSLDMLHLVHFQKHYFITILLPMNDKASAAGLLGRFLNTLEDEKDKEFDHMIFDMQQLDLLNKYYRDDYEN
ncbi:Extracellular Matrix protein PelD [hydrothermal vent metagenome]|uniref:Extracellular Matrix protein PelD n=1 Tax=hydrothermal vent metagenome TaxID=652676 RepID=A0A1W1BY44_9ZZZZ